MRTKEVFLDGYFVEYLTKLQLRKEAKRRNIHIGPYAKIGNHASIDRCVEIEDRAVIGERAVIRTHAKIGSRVHIGDHAVIGICATIGHCVKIGERSIARDSSDIGEHGEVGVYVEIGKCARIGAKVSLDDGVNIGEYAKIGSHSSVVATGGCGLRYSTNSYIDKNDNDAYIAIGGSVRRVKEWENDFWSDKEIFGRPVRPPAMMDAYLCEFKKVCPGKRSVHEKEEK